LRILQAAESRAALYIATGRPSGNRRPTTNAYLDAPSPPADPQAIADRPRRSRPPRARCSLLRAFLNGEAKILRDSNSSMLEERGRIRSQKSDGLFPLCI
jgi:hypothetical protein